MSTAKKDLDAGLSSVRVQDMTLDAIKRDNARYADFAARMLACLAAEEQDIAARDARFASRQIVAANVDSDSATVRPSK